MRCGLAVLLLAGCEASVEGVPIDASPDGVGIDSVAMVPACASSAALSVCLSFDADPLPSPHPNQGSVAISAILVNVTRTAGANGGGAALLGATSEVSFPANSALTGIVELDAAIRLDAAVPAAGRVGILDTDESTAGMSLFVYAGTTTPHRVRCNIGGDDVYADTSIALGEWTQLGCTCENNVVAVWRDGIKLAEGPNCEPGTGTTTGMQIGQNSRAGDGLPPNEPLVGAIDRVRLFTELQ